MAEENKGQEASRGSDGSRRECQRLHAAYEAAQKPRDYAIAGFLASFLAGSSLILGKCGYRSK